MPILRFIAGPEPFFTQDGGWEIHPWLKGITFKFWNASDLNRGSKGQVFVNYEGDSEKAPWAHALTGRVYDSFETAKVDLRNRASEYARANGFKFRPEEHGYRWM